MKYIFAIFTLITSYTSFSQKLPSVEILQDSIQSSFRGLSVPADDVVWASGSNGTVGRSLDAGQTWKWMRVPGFEKRDFRDIEALDSLTAIIMAVDNPADILKTVDGGKSWKVVFHKEQEGMFLDAMVFDGESGFCIGDPITLSNNTKKQFFLLETKNAGNTWNVVLTAPISSSDESIFAASGTNIISTTSLELKYLFITGGKESNMIGEWRNHHGLFIANIPILQGTNASGAFSVYKNKKTIYIAGGDYVEYWKDSGNVVSTSNYGRTWKRSAVHGYRSCIIQVDKKAFITCGTNGVDISFDGCKTWKLIYGDGAKGTNGFNVCTKSKTGKAVYFAGTGRIGKLVR